MSVASIWKEFITVATELVTAPARHPEMIWIVSPLIVVIGLMTVYFAKHQDEELGWNTALGNSLVLIFVSIDLLRVFFTKSSVAMTNSLNYIGENVGAFLLILFLFSEGVVLIFVNFNHFLPKKTAYFLSSPLAINLTAYAIICFVYSQVKFSLISLVSTILLFLVLLAIFIGFGYASRRWWMRIERLKQKESVDDVRKEKKHLTKLKSTIKEKESKIKKVFKNNAKIEKISHRNEQKLRKIAKGLTKNVKTAHHKGKKKTGKTKRNKSGKKIKN